MNEQRRDDLLRTLVSLEEQAWQALSEGAGADFYQENLAPDALMVFPFGVLDREPPSSRCAWRSRGPRTGSTTRT